MFVLDALSPSLFQFNMSNCFDATIHDSLSPECVRNCLALSAVMVPSGFYAN